MQLVCHHLFLKLHLFVYLVSKAEPISHGTPVEVREQLAGESVPYLHHVGPMSLNSVVRLGCKHLYPLSHFTSRLPVPLDCLSLFSVTQHPAYCNSYLFTLENCVHSLCPEEHGFLCWSGSLTLRFCCLGWKVWSVRLPDHQEAARVHQAEGKEVTSVLLLPWKLDSVLWECDCCCFQSPQSSAASIASRLYSFKHQESMRRDAFLK